MFETPFVERFSRIHPITPFAFWLPVIAYAEARALAEGLPIAALAGAGLAGVLLWTLAEYSLHRWVFHWTGPRPWQRRAHFVIHGVHHDFPSDGDRLVMPLGVSVPLGIGFYLLFAALFGPLWAKPLFGGMALGYLAYDGLHWAIHHLPMRSRPARWIKRHHLLHHHTGARSRWGVSSPLWDWVFGTLGGDAPRQAC